MNYIIGRWETGGTRVYYTLDFTRANCTTHVRGEALNFGSKASAEAFLSSDGILNIYSHPWHIIQEHIPQEDDSKSIFHYPPGINPNTHPDLFWSPEEE